MTAQPATAANTQRMSSSPSHKHAHGSENTVPGVDVLRIANRTISGWFDTYKGPSGPAKWPYTTNRERLLALYLEYHPLVAWYQRGDASASFVERWGLDVQLPTPYAIDYLFENEPHHYLPDVVGEMTSGGLLVAEAGLAKRKVEPRERAKAEAARFLALSRQGVFWLALESQLAESTYTWNLVKVHQYRETSAPYREIAPAIQALWPIGTEHSIAGLSQALNAQWPVEQVEAVAWKIVADAVAAGHALIDLEQIQLARDTPLRLTEPTSPVILPTLVLPMHIDEAVTTRPAWPLSHGWAADEPDEPDDPDDPDGGDATSSPQEREAEGAQRAGAVIDSSALPSKRRKAFFQRLNAVRQVRQGATRRRAARDNGLTLEEVRRALARVEAFGEGGLAPYGAYARKRRAPTMMRGEFAALARTLYGSRMRPSKRHVAEHPKMAELARQLSKDEGKPVLVPSYQQIWYLLYHEEKGDPKLRHARSGSKHAHEPRRSFSGYIASIPAPGLIVNVDEHDIDVLICLPSGEVRRQKLYGLALLDVMTAAPLALLLSMTAPTEWDYLRLVKQAMEPKATLAALMGCLNEWPCQVQPAIILCDRGKIFTSRHVTEVLVNRFHVTQQIAPPYAPPVKGTVEACFKWMTERFEHRLPGTTKSNPIARGQYDSVGAAAKAALTFEEFRSLWYRAWVDGYMRSWNDLRGGTPAELWQESALRFGVRQWVGSSEELSLLLMQVVNHKYPGDRERGFTVYENRTVSWGGSTYVAEQIIRACSRVSIRADREDIRAVYLYSGSQYLCPAYDLKYSASPLPVSDWQRREERRAQNLLAKRANQESSENLTQIVADAYKSAAQRRKDAQRAEVALQQQQQRAGAPLHTSHVENVLRALQRTFSKQAGIRNPASSAAHPSIEDGLLVPALEPHLEPHWEAIRAAPVVVRPSNREPIPFHPFHSNAVALPSLPAAASDTKAALKTETADSANAE